LILLNTYKKHKKARGHLNFNYRCTAEC